MPIFRERLSSQTLVSSHVRDRQSSIGIAWLV
jgi:hypothetical protein